MIWYASMHNFSTLFLLLGGLDTSEWNSDSTKRNLSPAFIVLNDENKFQIWHEAEEKTEIDFSVGKTYHVMLQQYAENWIGDERDKNDQHYDCNHNTDFCSRTANYRFVVFVDCELKYETNTKYDVVAYDPVYLHIFQQDKWWWEEFKDSDGIVEDFLIGTTFKIFLISPK